MRLALVVPVFFGLCGKAAVAQSRGPVGADLWIVKPSFSASGVKDVAVGRVQPFAAEIHRMPWVSTVQVRPPARSRASKTNTETVLVSTSRRAAAMPAARRRSLLRRLRRGIRTRL